MKNLIQKLSVATFTMLSLMKNTAYAAAETEQKLGLRQNLGVWLQRADYYILTILVFLICFNTFRFMVGSAVAVKSKAGSALVKSIFLTLFYVVIKYGAILVVGLVIH